MALGDKYHAKETEYAAGEAEYEGSDFNFQIVDHSDDIIALFTNKEERDHVLALINANPFPE